MQVLAFAGMPFSGKSEAVKIAKEMDIPIIRMGEYDMGRDQKAGTGTE